VNKVQAMQKPYRALRIINWSLSVLVFSGAVMSLLIAKGNPAIMLATVAFLALVVAIYAGTAITINLDVSTIMGIPIGLYASTNLTFYSLTTGNALFSLLGLWIVITCLASSQYLPSLSGVLYFLVSIANIMALKQRRKWQLMPT
jgi:hypothetical protein